MKAYGIRKRDNDCCPGHAKYGVRGLTAFGVKRSRNRPHRKLRDKSRKAKMRQAKIEIE
jgi:hypothetical protein